MKTGNYIALSLVFFLLTFIVYVNYLDILIPGLPNGSYRLAIGSLFIVPAFLLGLGQTMIGGLILYFAATSVKGNVGVKFPLKKEYKKLVISEYIKSVFIASIATFMFSLTYFFYPFYGPFYYIVFAVGGPAEAIFVEILWTALMVLTVTVLTMRIHKINKMSALIIALLVMTFITVGAS